MYTFHDASLNQGESMHTPVTSVAEQAWAANELIKQSDETIARVDRSLRLSMIYNGLAISELFQGKLKVGVCLTDMLDNGLCAELGSAFDHGKVRSFKYLLRVQSQNHWLRIRLAPSGAEATLFIRDITRFEQRRIEQAKLLRINEKAQKKILRNLAWSEHTHKALIESLPDAILIVNAKMQIKNLLNADRIQGLLQGEKMGKRAHIQNLKTDRESIDKIEQSIQDIVQSRQSSAELVMPVNGNYLEVHLMGLLGGDVMILLRDITHRVLSEKVLQATLQELSMIKDALDQSSAVLSWLPDGSIIRINDTMKKLTGYSKEETTAMSIQHLLEEGLAEGLVVEALANGRLKRVEWSLRRKDGGYNWLDATLIPIFTTQGQISEYVLIGYDITLKHLAEQQLVAQKQLMEMVINAAPNLISLTDSASRFKLVSESFCDLLELKAEQIVGNTIEALLQTSLSSAGKAFLGQLSEWTHNEVRQEWCLPGLRGTDIWFDVLQKPVHLGAGEEQILLVASNISDRKRAMQALMMKNAELSDANVMLEKINAELDKFVYSASHNLRAPLTSILGLISLMRIDGQSSEYLNLMEQSIRRLDGFITDIISYSKNARQEIELAPIAFETLLRNVFADLAFFNAKPSVRIEITVKEQGIFYSDLKRLEMVLSNLLSNAFKYHNYMQQDPFIQAEVQVHPHEAFIYIRDNGQGIAAEHIDKIFKMFYRATESSEGSGIGLYIVKEVVHKLGGTIDVQSKIGEGTTFTLLIPGADLLQMQPDNPERLIDRQQHQ